MKKSLLFCLLILFVNTLCFAQSNYTESLTITTYYPAPYGVYRNLKLNPSDAPPIGPALSPGVLYFDNTTPAGTIKYYNKVGEWVNLTEGGGGSPGDILINAAHTKDDCRKAGGTPTASGTSFQICRLPGGACPTGWHQYENWGTYVQTTGCCYGGTCYCVYPRHAFGSEYGLNASAWSNYRPCGVPGGTGCILYNSLSVPYVLWQNGDTYCSPATEIGCY